MSVVPEYEQPSEVTNLGKAPSADGPSHASARARQMAMSLSVSLRCDLATKYFGIVRIPTMHVIRRTFTRSSPPSLSGAWRRAAR